MIPNLLSLLRLALGPVLFLDLTAEQRFLVVILAGITDGLDGWLARRFDQTSKLGALLDPLCDKGFALCTLTFCWHTDAINLSVLLALVAREFALLVLALAWAVRRIFGFSSRLYVGTCYSSKLFTTLQFGVLGAAILGHSIPSSVVKLLWTFAGGALIHWLRASARGPALSEAEA